MKSRRNEAKLLSYTLLYDRSGKLVTERTSTDITELKNKEIELTRFQEGIENMDMGMAFWDKTDHLIYANKGLRDFNKDIGFDMKPGVSRIEMLSNQIDKNAMDYVCRPPGATRLEPLSFESWKPLLS